MLRMVQFPASTERQRIYCGRGQIKPPLVRADIATGGLCTHRGIVVAKVTTRTPLMRHRVGRHASTQIDKDGLILQTSP